MLNVPSKEAQNQPESSVTAQKQLDWTYHWLQLNRWERSMLKADGGSRSEAKSSKEAVPLVHRTWLRMPVEWTTEKRCRRNADVETNICRIESMRTEVGGKERVTEVDFGTNGSGGSEGGHWVAKAKGGTVNGRKRREGREGREWREGGSEKNRWLRGQMGYNDGGGISSLGYTYAVLRGGRIVVREERKRDVVGG